MIIYPFFIMFKPKSNYKVRFYINLTICHIYINEKI